MSDSLDNLIACATQLPFVQLVACLEERLGCRVGCDDELRVQFAHDPALVFHAQDVIAVSRDGPSEARARVCITTAFAGLVGAVSPLPTALIDDFAIDDESVKSARALLDVFHHRLIALFYRGLRALDPPAAPDAPCRAWLLALCGLSPEAAPSVTGLAEAQILALAPLLVAYPPNAERLRVGLVRILADVLCDATISIVCFAGARVALDVRAQARLGCNLRLARGTALGTHVPAPAAAIAVDLAQLSSAACARLGPGGDRWRVLCAVIRLLTPESIAVALTLSPAAAPALRLGSADARLSWHAWLGSGAQPAPFRRMLCARATQGASFAVRH